MLDATNRGDVSRTERTAYNKIMNAMLTLEPTSQMKVLGAIAIMVKPTPTFVQPDEPDSGGQ